MKDPLVCTFPGRHGDILWALPTVRALAEQDGNPVGLVISGKYGSLAPLIRLQPYIDFVHVEYSWQVQETAPMTPRIPPKTLFDDRVVHLGYEGWPSPNLPRDVADRAKIAIDLKRPWIQLLMAGHAKSADIAVGFTDEYFELKYGLYKLVQAEASCFALSAPKSRWEKEGGIHGVDWMDAGYAMRDAQVFLGCCSALHVLAVAMGKKVVVMEPNPDRHNDVFWPLGKKGRVELVLGGDGTPTFDARHVRDTLRASLKG